MSPDKVSNSIVQSYSSMLINHLVSVLKITKNNINTIIFSKIDIHLTTTGGCGGFEDPLFQCLTGNGIVANTELFIVLSKNYNFILSWVSNQNPSPKPLCSSASEVSSPQILQDSNVMFRNLKQSPLSRRVDFG